MPDLDLHLPAIAQGDADAFGRWLAGAEALLRASLRRFAAQVDVEAVLQEALLRVWQVAPKVTLDGRPDALLRLAFRVARNLAVDEARRAGFRATLGEDDLVRLLDALAGDVAPEAPDPLLRRLISRRATARVRDDCPRGPPTYFGTGAPGSRYGRRSAQAMVTTADPCAYPWTEPALIETASPSRASVQARGSVTTRFTLDRSASVSAPEAFRLRASKHRLVRNACQEVLAAKRSRASRGRTEGARRYVRPTAAPWPCGAPWQ